MIIEKILDEYFPNPKAFLNYVNNYTFTVAVLLSAQCTDIKVNSVTKELFSIADNPKDMLKLGFLKLSHILSPLGLYRKKTKFLLETSKILIDKYNGEIPKEIKLLEKLPGVGHKTASVVVSHLFNKPAFPVDTHVYRCARRWNITNSKDIKVVEKDLKSFFAEKDWYKRHLQIISFGRVYCKAKNHKINECPMCSAL